MRENWTKKKKKKKNLYFLHIYIYSFLEAKAMKFKHIESLFRIIRAFLNFLFRIFIIYLFIYSFIHSLLFFLPPSNTILSRLRYSITFLHPRIADDAAYRSFRGSNCAASPRGLTAGTSLHDDSTIAEEYTWRNGDEARGKSGSRPGEREENG